MMRSVAGVMMVLLLATQGALNAQPDPVVTDTAYIRTTAGTITLELYGEDAPRAVENFVTLASRGFYRGLLFHRVVPGFVIQTGDPATRDTSRRSTWGTGGESCFGGPFDDELNPNSASYKRGYIEGALAMANHGPNTNTSQFFIAMNKGMNLAKTYTIFGRVIKGMDVAHKIERAPLADIHSGLPLHPVAITDITIRHVGASHRAVTGR
jgi:peptidylprolyl isomerase domain and WD repeat-containing protein 1